MPLASRQNLKKSSGRAFGIAWAFALLLSACGGGGGGDFGGKVDAAPVPPSLSVDVAGCGSAAVHDSGKLLYVVMDRDCAANDAPRAVGVRYGSLTTRPVPLTLRLGQEVLGVEIPGLGRRQVGLFQSGQWRRFANDHSWVGRDGAGLLVLNGSLYLLGGWANGPVTSEVWRTDDLENWTFLGNAPWEGRHGAARLVHRNRLWVIGGDLYTDVWSSADGIQWEQATADAGFGARYTPNAAVVNDEIVLYAGQDWEPIEWCNSRPDCKARGNRSVWRSGDGKTWTKILAQAPWAGRALIHGSVVHQGQIFLIGGGLEVAPPPTSVIRRPPWSTRTSGHRRTAFAGLSNYLAARSRGARTSRWCTPPPAAMSRTVQSARRTTCRTTSFMRPTASTSRKCGFPLTFRFGTPVH